MSVLIEAKDLHKEYRMSESVIISALNGVSFEVEKGEFLAINGHSGSGKSTLLNLLGLIDNPTKGEIFIDGNDINKFSEKEKTKFRLNSIGFVFQFFNLIDNYTAIENIIFQLKLQKISNSECKERAQGIIDFLGMTERADSYPKELSGGEQQRIAIGRAIAKDSIMILVDEPTAHLDVENSKIVIELLKKVNKTFNRTIILVTHEDEEAKEADRVITMRDGKIMEIKKITF